MGSKRIGIQCTFGKSLGDLNRGSMTSTKAEIILK